MKKWGCLGRGEWFNSVNELRGWTPRGVGSVRPVGEISSCCKTCLVSLLCWGRFREPPDARNDCRLHPPPSTPSFVEGDADSQQTDWQRCGQRSWWGHGASPRSPARGQSMCRWVGAVCVGSGSGLGAAEEGVEPGETGDVAVGRAMCWTKVVFPRWGPWLRMGPAAVGRECWGGADPQGQPRRAWSGSEQGGSGGRSPFPRCP